jgi:hypothetical protein
MIVLFWSRATRDLFRSFGWGIAELHRENVATKLPRPRRRPIASNNYRHSAWQLPDGDNPVARVAAMCGTDAATFTRERPGMSAFVLEGGVVYHTYSTYARGLDGLWACTSGSTAPQRDATRPASGGVATTSTTSAEPSRGCRGATVPPTRLPRE